MSILLRIIFVILELFFYHYVRNHWAKNLRKYVLFLIVRNVLSWLISPFKQFEWDLMWSLELVNCVWINYLACSYCAKCFKKALLVKSTPYIVSVSCLFFLPFHKTGSEMREFELALLLFSLIIVLVGISLSYLREFYQEVCYYFAWFIVCWILPFVVWRFFGYSQRSFLLAEVAGVGFLVYFALQVLFDKIQVQS